MGRDRVDDDLLILHLLPEGVSRQSRRSIGGKQFIESKKSASDVVGRVPRVSTPTRTPDAIETSTTLTATTNASRSSVRALSSPSTLALARTARWQISPSASSSHHLQSLYLTLREVFISRLA